MESQLDGLEITGHVAAKAGPMPTRLGTDDREDLQDRRKPSIQQDKEPAIVVRKPGPAAQPCERIPPIVGCAIDAGYHHAIEKFEYSDKSWCLSA